MLYAHFFTFHSQVKGVNNIKFKTLADVEEVYGKNNLVKLVNLKQILFYCKNGLQPVFIEEGYKGKLVAWYHKPSTSKLWEYWKENDPKGHRMEEYDED